MLQLFAIFSLAYSLYVKSRCPLAMRCNKFFLRCNCLE